MKNALVGVATMCAMSALAAGAVVSSTSHGDKDLVGLEQPIAVGDLLSGLIAAEQNGDAGWHPANTADQDHLPAFTDDHGPNGRTLYGLLNDVGSAPPGPGYDQPVKLVRYDLGGSKNIGEIRIYSGNINNVDGRIFSTTVVQYSTDGGEHFQDLGYFQSDPSGTLNNTDVGKFNSTLVRIYDDHGEAILSGVTHLQFNFYGVHRGNDLMHDPFNGVNPFTNTDDALPPPFVSPLIWEIDALGFAGEVCNNNIDDDGDNLKDCADPDCFDSPSCPCNRPYADIDGDGDVDQSDFGSFQLCYTGAVVGLPALPGIDCGCFDRNGDQAVSEFDYAAFVKCVSGPNLPAVQTCGD